MRIADSIIRLHHRKGTPALARICRPHSLSLSSWRFFWCLCVFFFLPRESWTEDGVQFRPRLSIDAALTTLRNTQEHQKTASYASNLVPILESEKTLGARLATQVATQTDRVALASISQAKRNANAGITRGGRAGCPRGAVSLGGATLGPVPSLLPLNRSFCVACRPMFGLKNSVFLWWKCVGEVFKVS